MLWQFFLMGRDEIQLGEELFHVSLYDNETKKILRLGLEEYLVGVVAAEMPASFPVEALKAQSIAARTYAVQRLKVPDPRVKALNPQADLCSDHNVNQAWISTEEMKKRWGTWNYPKYYQKICQAVKESKGKVLIYEQQLIDPVYHASCGGVGTENSEDVWKFAIPYLRSVPCTNHPYDQKEEVVAMSLEEFYQKLGGGLGQATRNKAKKEVIKIQEKTKTGRVKSVAVGDKIFTGTEIRSKLNLKSTLFTVEVAGNTVKFHTSGYGHGVGMCQYGAGAMAREGKTAEEILTYYYTGVKLANIR